MANIDDDINYLDKYESRNSSFENIKMPEITKFDVMDSDFLMEKFKETMSLAKIAVDKQLEALEAEDYEKVQDCMSICSSAFSNFSSHYWGKSSASQLTDYIESKLGEKHKEILQQKAEEYQALSPDMSNEEIISKFSDFVQISRICNSLTGREEKEKTKTILAKVVKDKISQLDTELSELKEHIEIPENELKMDEIQSQIEELETAWATSVEYTLDHVKSEHQKARIEEQGLDMPVIMSDIQETAKLKGRISRVNYDRINEAVNKKSEYLERKLAYLQQYRDIPGNEERIAEIESQIERMQDSWVIARSGVDIQAIIEKNSQRIDENKARLPKIEKELEYTLKYEPRRVGLIQRLEFNIKNLKEDISTLENKNMSIQTGTDAEYVGEHHKGRLEKEEKAKAEEQAKIKAEQEEKARAEEQARIKTEQEEKARIEEQARIKAEQEEKARAEEQARIKAEQEEKARVEEQARIKAEQEKKERAKAEQERKIAIEKDKREYEQYKELITRKPEIEKLYDHLYYEDFLSQSNGYISDKMETLMKKVKDLPDEEKRVLLNQYNKNATYQINEQGVFADEEVRKKAEQESRLRAEEQARTKAEQEKKAREMEKFIYEQPQVERIRPKEESIRDQVGDDKDKQLQESKTPSVDLWMNRFNSWYNAIDRVSQNVKTKFVKMKSDIMNAISNTLKERMNKREQNEQEQDSNEK